MSVNAARVQTARKKVTNKFEICPVQKSLEWKFARSDWVL